MREPAGGHPRSRHKWWEIAIYVAGFCFIAFSLIGCSAFDPSMEDTIATVRSQGGCSHVGTEIKVKIKNIGGVESIMINCDWTVAEQEEF